MSRASHRTRAVAVLVPALALLGVCGIAHADDVVVHVTPHASPVVVQPSGGTVDYRVDVHNRSTTAETFQFWTFAQRPSGAIAGPLIGPQVVTLPAGWRAAVDLSTRIPAGLPDGHYTYGVAVGSSPTDVWSEDDFGIDKLAQAEPWFAQPTDTTSVLTAVDFVDTRHGWAAGSRDTILRTDDGGDNWYDTGAPPSINVADLAFVDTRQGWAVGGLGDILHTADGGRTWAYQDAATSADLSGVAFVDDQHGWAVGGRPASFSPPTRVIVHTDDGGQTWVPQLSENNMSPLAAVDFVDVQHGWAVGSLGTLLRTTDGGATWSPATTGTQLQLSDLDFLDPLHGWAVGRDGLVLVTDDGGVSWSSQVSGTTAGLVDVHFVDLQHGWAVGGDTGGSVVLATDDGGTTWSMQAASGYPLLAGVDAVDLDHAWAVGNLGTILATRTGGW
ncbi:MAG: hypothetical protein H6733_07010 [Alphaproteobacteria bacterium]|nr:hypothetical protein [Alphaproteobacteria bacterium]